ncbi:hypothetical protein D1872_298040 [compost metagenome]
MRGPEGTVSFGGRLFLIAQINPREAVLVHALHHMLKRVIRMRLLAVGIDPHKRNPFFPEGFGGFSRNFVGSDHKRTVVACEKNNQIRGSGEALQCVFLAVRGRKPKVRGFFTNR